MKNIRINQLAKIYRKALGTKRIAGFDFTMRPDLPWPWEPVPFFANGRKMSIDSYVYYRTAADELSKKLLIPES